MTAFKQYFEDNPEIFAALVAAIAILGGLLGSIIGAKIQANGGRDQAAAAREAARIAAEAQHVAALWSVQHIQTAEYIRIVHELSRLSTSFYKQDSTGGALEEQISTVYREMIQKLAEIELVASVPVVEAARAVRHAVDDVTSNAQALGPAAYLESHVRRLAFRPIGESHPGAPRAMRALAALKLAHTSGDDASTDAYQEARDAVRQLPGVNEYLATEALGIIQHGDYEQLRREVVMELAEKRRLLVDAARGMLKSGESIPIMPPPPRRGWQQVDI
ncbi:hypothetical protein [Streptomyces sp. st77]|uniref:hypothetical protein n=1 Tax=Streptomyces sp. st77 TaxID=1828074 RepID=UPI000BFD9891|nr:hypothetical protein [Streptomyces sp. st77]